MHNEDEYRQLEAENKRLKQLLKENGIFYLEDGEELSLSEKIEIFKSYFRGNDTVLRTVSGIKIRINMAGHHPVKTI